MTTSLPSTRSIDETRSEQLGRQLASHLSQGAAQLPHDISERLRAARVQACERRQEILVQEAPALFVNGQANGLQLSHSHWWGRLGVFGLLLLVVLALFTVSVIQDDIDARELAEIDGALLADDLPLGAYVDRGFAQYLRTEGRIGH